MPLRLGLIGCGGMGRELAQAIRQGVPQAQVVAACDPFPAAREQAAMQFGTPTVATVAELLARDDLQAVLIASPNHLHCEQTVAAAAAGKHVFCEKPMALSVADCESMIAACRRAGVKLMVGHSSRLHPAVRRLREVLAAGELGRPVHAWAIYFFSGFRPRNSGVWHLDKARSGGVLFHMGIHQIDLFHALLGRSVRVHYAGGRHGNQARDFDDVASILIEYESGATGVISVAAISPAPANEAAFVFTGGYARLSDHLSTLAFGGDADHLCRLAPGDLPGPNAVEVELGSFVRWVLNDEWPVLTAAEGRAAVAVAEAADQAKVRGCAVAVPPALTWGWPGDGAGGPA
jgi:phthalate 4,5-cis-dihydrodiol dehydrogenase